MRGVHGALVLHHVVVELGLEVDLVVVHLQAVVEHLVADHQLSLSLVILNLVVVVDVPLILNVLEHHREVNIVRDGVLVDRVMSVSQGRKKSQLQMALWQSKI